MRRAWLAAAIALLAASPALAQAWQEYRYPEDGFGVQFPAPPTVTTATYRTLAGASVPANIYSVTSDGVSYSVTVADFSKSHPDGEAVMTDAVRRLGETGKITVDTTERVNRNYGHDIALTGKDGSRTAAAIFFANDSLYELVARAADPDAGSAKTARFQQTLVFIDRTPRSGGRLGSIDQDPEPKPG